jgi:hypothetical protein
VSPLFPHPSASACLNTWLYTFLAKAIDRYIQLRCQEQTGKREKLDPRLQTIIEGIFKQCIDEGDYTQACRLRATITTVLTYLYRPLVLPSNRVGLTSYPRFTRSLMTQPCSHTPWKLCSTLVSLCHIATMFFISCSLSSLDPLPTTLPAICTPSLDYWSHLATRHLPPHSWSPWSRKRSF